LVPPVFPIVEVGCDHGHIAAALGAIGTERRRHRLPRRRDIPLVVGDGLRCFARIGVAVITGIGAHQIARILRRGPRPELAVLHAPDRPGWLRRWCADNGWRIDAERLAPEARGFAEVTRVVPGQESSRGLALEFGPFLPQDPLVGAHARERTAHWQRILAAVQGRDEEKTREARAWLSFMEPWLALDS